MSVSKSIFLIFILINIIFIGKCDCSNYLVNLSFLISFISIVHIAYYTLFIEKLFSPYLASYFVFSFLFFFIAPLTQINGLPEITDIEKRVFLNTFPNTLPYNPISVIILNIFVFVWNIVFMAAYITFKKTKKLIYVSEWKITSKVKGNFPLYILVILILSIMVIYSQFDFITNRILYKDFIGDNMSMQKMLIVVKTYFSIPYIGLVMTIVYLKRATKINVNWFIVIISFILIFIAFILVKNPMIEKRNALGPVFISLLLFIKPKLLNSNKRFVSFLFLSMVIVFPLISILTHSKVGLEKLISKPSLISRGFSEESVLDEFRTLHYDAYSNTLATMDYVKNNGISYGYQFFGGVFFFIPRSIWTSKPESTGKFIGQYLIRNYNMWYDNISNPFLSEGIINFSYLSVFIFPILLAWFIVIMLKWQYSADLFKQVTAIYFSIHLMFLLRGDFTNGWAYFIGTFVGIYIIPKIVTQFINSLPKKKLE